MTRPFHDLPVVMAGDTPCCPLTDGSQWPEMARTCPKYERYWKSTGGPACEHFEPFVASGAHRACAEGVRRSLHLAALAREALAVDGDETSWKLMGLGALALAIRGEIGRTDGEVTR